MTSTSIAATPTRSSADPGAVWASAATTLEYAIDDFSISQFAARFADQPAVYGEFIRRAGNWRRLLNRHSHKIEPRFSSGAFRHHYDNLGGGGFVEGNSFQYTWMVPQDPAGLFRAIGDRTAATVRLDSFLRRLNGSSGATHTTHALLGNEPNLNVPWLYDWTRRPFKTQAAVRRAILRLYGTSPAGYPGNDDLGELGSWYVFGALGLYPEVPGVGLLAVGSPLFRHASIHLHGGRRVLITAAGASPRNPYIEAHAVQRAPLRPAVDDLVRARPRCPSHLPARHPPEPRPGATASAALPASYGPGHPLPAAAGPLSA